MNLISSTILFVYFLILIILEIVNLIKGINMKNINYIKKSTGIYHGIFSAIIMYYLYLATGINSFDKGGWGDLIIIFLLLFFGIINIIIGIIRFILKRIKLKNLLKTNTQESAKKIFFKISFISLLLLLLKYDIRLYEKNKIDNYIKENATTYIKNNYGITSFELLNIDRNFLANGWIETDELDYYKVKIKYNMENIIFYVYLEVDDIRNIILEKSDDDLLWKLYKSNESEIENTVKTQVLNKINTLEEYLRNQKFNLSIRKPSIIFSTHSSDYISNNYGKIPAKEDLIKLVVNKEFMENLYIDIDPNEIEFKDEKQDLLNYLTNLSNSIISYYDGTKDFKFKYHYTYKKNNKYYHGNVTINQNEIIIELYNEKYIVKRYDN